jgi:DNA-binding transcriptional ArsR family regulator
VNRPVLTIAELAAALGDSRRTVERQLADGTLERFGLIEANRRGRRRHFDAASVEQVLWRRRVGGLRRVS